jgi:type II secretory pathway pseudopilin PulG
LVVVVLLAIFAAVVVINIQGTEKETEVPAALQVTQVISKQIDVYRQVHGKWPTRIEELWFQNYKLPVNPLVRDHPRTINSDIDGTNNPAKWHPENKTTSSFPFWYNATNGAVRIRVPKQATDTETLALYNAANGSNATSLGSTSLTPDK